MVTGAGAHEIVHAGYAGVARLGVPAAGVLTENAEGERKEGSADQAGLWARGSA